MQFRMDNFLHMKRMAGCFMHTQRQMPFCPGMVTGCKRLQQKYMVGCCLMRTQRQMPFCPGMVAGHLLKTRAAPWCGKTNIFVIYVPRARELTVHPHKSSWCLHLFAFIFVICRFKSLLIAFGGQIGQKNGKNGAILCVYGYNNQLLGT